VSNQTPVKVSIAIKGFGAQKQRRRAQEWAVSETKRDQGPRSVDPPSAGAAIVDKREGSCWPGLKGE